MIVEMPYNNTQITDAVRQAINQEHPDKKNVHPRRLFKTIMLSVVHSMVLYCMLCTTTMATLASTLNKNSVSADTNCFAYVSHDGQWHEFTIGFLMAWIYKHIDLRQILDGKWFDTKNPKYLSPIHVMNMAMYFEEYVGRQINNATDIFLTTDPSSMWSISDQFMRFRGLIVPIHVPRTVLDMINRMFASSGVSSQCVDQLIDMWCVMIFCPDYETQLVSDKKIPLDAALQSFDLSYEHPIQQSYTRNPFETLPETIRGLPLYQTLVLCSYGGYQTFRFQTIGNVLENEMKRNGYPCIEECCSCFPDNHTTWLSEEVSDANSTECAVYAYRKAMDVVAICEVLSTSHLPHFAAKIIREYMRQR